MVGQFFKFADKIVNAANVYFITTFEYGQDYTRPYAILVSMVPMPKDNEFIEERFETAAKMADRYEELKDILGGVF